MILRCDFCDKPVETIRPRAHTFELDGGKTVPIILKPSQRPQDAPPLRENQEFIPRHKHVSPKIQPVNRVVLPAESQTFIQIKTKREGLILVTPTSQTYKKTTMPRCHLYRSSETRQTISYIT